MSHWNLPWDGGCLCGGIRSRVTQPPLLTLACHCHGCQRLAASAFSRSISVPVVGFAVTQGEPVLGGKHGLHRPYYCSHCKNWIFTRPQGLDGFLVNVRATMLDDHAWVEPFVEVNTREGLPWAKTGAPHSFEAEPGPSGFQPLVEEFASKGRRPG